MNSFNYKVINYEELMSIICTNAEECRFGHCPYSDGNEGCIISETINKMDEENKDKLALKWIKDKTLTINRALNTKIIKDSYLCPRCKLHSFTPDPTCPNCGASMSL